MLMGERDEMLIQKCVDEELCWEETRSLLCRLDSLDNGWKTLACGLLEDRNLRRSLRLRDGAAASLIPEVPTHAVQPVATVASTARLSAQHWWSHPLTSMALCAAIAFVGGILIPDFRHGESLNIASTGKPGSLPTRLPGNSVQHAVSAADSGEMSYRLQMTPGGQLIDVPVYRQPNDLYRQDRNNPLFSHVGNGEGGQVQFLLVPVEENRSLVIPVSEDPYLEMQ
jgi:hypothetical protein